MKFNKDSFQQAIEESWENNLIDILNKIDCCNQERCPASPYILELLHVTATEAYLAAVKTIEDALISSIEDCDLSDTYLEES